MAVEGASFASMDGLDPNQAVIWMEVHGCDR